MLLKLGDVILILMLSLIDIVGCSDMSYLGVAGLRHVSVPIKERRTQVVAESSTSSCNVGSGYGSTSSSSLRSRFNVFSAIHEGAPLFAEMNIGESDSRPFNTAILPTQSMSVNNDFNLRVSNMMLRFYRWTRSRGLNQILILMFWMALCPTQRNTMESPLLRQFVKSALHGNLGIHGLLVMATVTMFLTQSTLFLMKKCTLFNLLTIYCTCGFI